ncbi:MAG: PDDEXK nuclease domain-containing protein [Candidatus Electrothrix sp. GW3-4]|uniref:PDDEXK nuclease domain-containing protein n=1 Tax=Candidatus Electrothrix sp. GW3-4 TaxID=3126740 RepID=UPI0030D13553
MKKNNTKEPQKASRSDASFLTSVGKNMLPNDYASVLKELKERIRSERLRVTLAANSALILLYWDIGKIIVERQQQQGWGAKIIDRISFDLKHSFPEMSGFSPRNLKYMRKFAEAWPDQTIVQRTVAQIPWRSNLALLEKLDDVDTRLWYAQKTVENGWSRNILVMQIESRLHERQGQTVNNFAATLPPPDSDMATQIFKDPYLFDFLGTADLRKEREVEQALMDHVQEFLLEMGAGFSFVGRQMLLEVGDQDFRLDLLFYHLKLRCFVVVELKAVPFDPGFTGQLNLYLSAVDDLMRHPDDKPTIGLLLCKSKNELVVEYALRGLNKPMGVAQWETQLTETLPDNLKDSLPSIEEIEAELKGEV